MIQRRLVSADAPPRSAVRLRLVPTPADAHDGEVTALCVQGVDGTVQRHPLVAVEGGDGLLPLAAELGGATRAMAPPAPMAH